MAEWGDVGVLRVGALQLPDLVAVGAEGEELVGARVLGVALVEDVGELGGSVDEVDAERGPERVLAG